MKYNLANGGPAPESVTNKIYEKSKTLTSYKIADIPEVDINTIGSKKYGDLEVEIIDSVEDYVIMLKEIFDFDLIRSFFKSQPDFKVLFDALSGVTGPYGVAIFEKELGLEHTELHTLARLQWWTPRSQSYIRALSCRRRRLEEDSLWRRIRR
jgi:phosphoglucomutase